jgi:hypothetical protein
LATNLQAAICPCFGAGLAEHELAILGTTPSTNISEIVPGGSAHEPDGRRRRWTIFDDLAVGGRDVDPYSTGSPTITAAVRPATSTTWK